MTIAEAELGGHPLEGLSDSSVRSILVGDWKPTTSTIDAPIWRALLGGLLQRAAALRWGSREVGLCLGGDMRIIAEGLKLGGEAASETPFMVGGTPVQSARAFAQAALTGWQIIR
jgi:hypothetical protein